MQSMKVFAAAAAACAVLTMPTIAQANPGVTEAENIRKLDIMLMVTSLRCRTGEHDSRQDYQRFTTNNIVHLNRAYEKMRTNLSARYGNHGSKRALDKISVGMANSYGNGHPWLGCAELKQVAVELSTARNQAQLSAEASRLLSPQRVALNGAQ